MRPNRPRVIVLLVVAGLLAGLMPTPVLAAPAAKTNWSRCFQTFGPFECATVAVPLDYDNPSGPTISIAMVRLPAASPDARQGSLFINPGGPGGSGVDFAVFAAPFLFTQDVRDRFDIVGFDPRGILRSNTLRCFGTDRQWDPYFTPFFFPLTQEETAAWITADRYLDEACARRGGRIIDHMSTANVARDLDRLRIAVGDERLTYAGYSYGSMLGQTYANLFPESFRALVIDGVLDPIAWTNGAAGQEHLPFSTRLRSDEGAMETLSEFFRLCDENPEECAFSDSAADRYAALADRLRNDGPIMIPDPSTGEPFPYNYSFLIGDTLGAMYDSFSWPFLAEFLAALESIPDTAAAGAALASFRVAAGLLPKRGFPHYPNFVEGFPAVACADSQNPDDYQAWIDAATASEDEFGYFGPLWTWVSSICAEWPGADADRYEGPFDTSTEAPVLVVSTLFDPATRYEGALTAHGLLPNSSLLTVQGWGHTSLFLSACADEVIADYLIQGVAPAGETVCAQDLVPFVDFGVEEAAGVNTAPALRHLIGVWGAGAE